MRSDHEELTKMFNNSTLSNNIVPRSELTGMECSMQREKIYAILRSIKNYTILLFVYRCR